jgi:hypothetical protein
MLSQGGEVSLALGLRYQLFSPQTLQTHGIKDPGVVIRPERRYQRDIK